MDLNSLNGLNYIKDMKIEHYSFGNITIDGQTFISDVIIYPDRVNSSWWRKEGHLLQIDDLSDITGAGLPVLIIGTGYYGTMRVPEETLKYIKSKGIEVFVENTQKAVNLYNEISSDKPTVAGLHLTC
ncbi:MAG: Mth938-like domain-containing protein [Candidatus Mariimomonas ferrooxydans]